MKTPRKKKNKNIVMDTVECSNIKNIKFNGTQKKKKFS